MSRLTALPSEPKLREQRSRRRQSSSPSMGLASSPRASITLPEAELSDRRVPFSSPIQVHRQRSKPYLFSQFYYHIISRGPPLLKLQFCEIRSPQSSWSSSTFLHASRLIGPLLCPKFLLNIPARALAIERMSCYLEGRRLRSQAS
ncbi:hypothetical protein K523DRAFT_86900 [Schizophyllum commune Tattone D]|nr:hypothetical protein K523DRAFT_86900 [Schizophyllum commune Tattone D]